MTIQFRWFEYIEIRPWEAKVKRISKEIVEKNLMINNIKCDPHNQPQSNKVYCC